MGLKPNDHCTITLQNMPYNCKWKERNWMQNLRLRNMMRARISYKENCHIDQSKTSPIFREEPLFPTTRFHVRAFPKVSLALSPPLLVSPTRRGGTYPAGKWFRLFFPWVSPFVKKAGCFDLCSLSANLLEYPGLLNKRPDQMAS